MKWVIVLLGCLSGHLFGATIQTDQGVVGYINESSPGHWVVQGTDGTMSWVNETPNGYSVQNSDGSMAWITK